MNEKIREHLEEKSKSEEQKLERTSSLVRVVGTSPEKEKEILDYIKAEDFDKQEFDKLEREKTPEELEIINGVMSRMPDFVKKYGGTPVQLKSEHIHIIDSNKLPEEERPKGTCSGRCSFRGQRIFVVRPADANKLDFAQSVAHEIMHMNSFHSAVLDNKSNTISERRSGFSIETKDGEESELYFRGINEAITEELTKRFDEEHFRMIPTLADTIKERDKCRADWSSERISKGLKDNPRVIRNLSVVEEKDGTDRVMRVSWKYIEERKRLREIVAELQRKNSEQFELKEDAFSIFAEAYFTGKMLKVSRLVEKTFGGGSFKRLGEEMKYKKPINSKTGK